MDVYGLLYHSAYSVDGIMKIASVIMCKEILAVITLIICYRVGTCRKPVFYWGRMGYYDTYKNPACRLCMSGIVTSERVVFLCRW